MRACTHRRSLTASCTHIHPQQGALQLLPSLTVPPTKPSSLRPVDAAAAAALRKEPPTIDFSTRHANGMPALTLRRNATGSFSWPSGGLATSADLDPASGYRLMGLFDGVSARGSAGGGVAFSADAGGGFAQYESGRTALSWKRGEGGSHYGPGGELLAAWRRWVHTLWWIVTRLLRAHTGHECGRGFSCLLAHLPHSTA